MNFIEQMVQAFSQPAEQHTYKRNGKEIDIHIKKLTLYENDRIFEKIGEMPKFDKTIAVRNWNEHYVYEAVKLCLVDENGKRVIKNDNEFAELTKKLGRDTANDFFRFVHDIATDVVKKPEKTKEEEAEEADEGGEKKD
ncbi:MAG: hypothetical protein LBI35_00745 [Burkholderiales bacterium]|jgi:hypothetical protein|nr:hypothetical protein [Burkholderiales bacterium]